ncbi:HAD family hydrolase [Effusibacillus consociatus]|uniref:HAD family hydrolase n=1 Tax=Effusibacillus consociatus TaxID=1117041 RepID=A0ABV9Q0V4_9BACL
MKRYKAICFDLDDTLYDSSWHYEQGVKATFQTLHPELDAEAAFRLVKERTDQLWPIFEEGTIDLAEYRRLRFVTDPVLNKVFDEKMADAFHAHYMSIASNYIRPFEGLAETMEELTKKHQLAVITNGPADAQWLKMQCLGIDSFIPEDRLFISGIIGAAKPHAAIFHHALNELGVEPHEAIHIGDSYPHDAEGALAVGMDAVWLNRNGSVRDVHPQVRVIRELKELLPLLKAC